MMLLILLFSFRASSSTSSSWCKPSDNLVGSVLAAVAEISAVAVVVFDDNVSDSFPICFCDTDDDDGDADGDKNAPERSSSRGDTVNNPLGSSSCCSCSGALRHRR